MILINQKKDLDKLFHFKDCKYCGKKVRRLVSVAKTTVCMACDEINRKKKQAKYREKKKGHLYE